jgi:hypothetical protein
MPVEIATRFNTPATVSRSNVLAQFAASDSRILVKVPLTLFARSSNFPLLICQELAATRQLTC